jgi:hypothetical protein
MELNNLVEAASGVGPIALKVAMSDAARPDIGPFGSASEGKRSGV